MVTQLSGQLSPQQGQPNDCGLRVLSTASAQARPLTVAFWGLLERGVNGSSS